MLRTHVIFGSNAIEHGINLIEDNVNNRRVLVVCGWNCARLDPLMWELEPRGFQINVHRVCDDATLDEALNICSICIDGNIPTIIAMGSNKVLDSAKLAVRILNKDACTVSDNSQLFAFLTSCGYENMQIPNNRENMKLVLIPSYPCLGSELSLMTSVSANISNQIIPINKIKFRHYINTLAPDLCLIQSTIADNMRMDLVHNRILGLLYLTIDSLLSETGCVQEMMCWNTLRELMPLIDGALEVMKLTNVYYLNCNIYIYISFSFLS